MIHQKFFLGFARQLGTIQFFDFLGQLAVALKA